MNYSILDWDSNQLGGLVARITGPYTPEGLDAVLHRMVAESVELAYWTIPVLSAPPLEVITALGGRLVDQKRQYCAELQPTDLAQRRVTVPLTSYTAFEPSPGIRELGRASGQYSRFRVDPHLPRHVFESI